MFDTSDFFDFIYNNSKNNGILILDENGTYITSNEAFKTLSGYENSDLERRNFRILFTNADRESGKPETEIKKVTAEGAANDNNYLMRKDGSLIWVNGESILVQDKEGQRYIIKIVHNIQAQKMLEGFLVESNEFLESIFQSIRQSVLLILDPRMKIVKVNEAFYKMFELTDDNVEGKRISEVNHSFWGETGLQKKIRDTIITNGVIKEEIFELETSSGDRRLIRVHSKIIDGTAQSDKRILIVLNDVTDKV
ncbi:MAG TPA: PAS domain-containing protein [Flavipsychrobacter sp.]|nr:PAS domain-containing protein [Flavipsychrobacter sp.]